MKTWAWVVTFIAIMGATNNFQSAPTLGGLIMYGVGCYLTLYLPVFIVREMIAGMSKSKR